MVQWDDNYIIFINIYLKNGLIRKWSAQLQLIHIFATKKIFIKKNIKNFTTKKWKFSDKNSDIFHISAQNIDCGYSF